MSVKTFLDTNILVYANDRRDSGKQEAAIRIVREALRESSAAVSTQVLMEYASVAVTKLGQERAAVARQLYLMERLEVIHVVGDTIRSALGLMAAHSLSFWDATIIAAAHAARCELLLSEDLGHGTRFGSLVVRNPFTAAGAT